MQPFRHQAIVCVLCVFVCIQKGQLQIVYPLHWWRLHLNVLRSAGFQTSPSRSPRTLIALHEKKKKHSKLQSIWDGGWSNRQVAIKRRLVGRWRGTSHLHSHRLRFFPLGVTWEESQVTGWRSWCRALKKNLSTTSHRVAIIKPWMEHQRSRHLLTHQDDTSSRSDTQENTKGVGPVWRTHLGKRQKPGFQNNVIIPHYFSINGNFLVMFVKKKKLSVFWRFRICQNVFCDPLVSWCALDHFIYCLILLPIWLSQQSSEAPQSAARANPPRTPWDGLRG